ncbi:hypothetical protein Q4563_21080, partial [Gilvimarinus sp. 1_MG-2023]|nr:hypothetical protein [Gilvimarinus sp. 1_MG-2023]
METSSQNQQENSGSHSLFSEHQGTYFAYWLTQSTNQQNRISQTVASSRVDMNPHQVEAACFALKSPLEKGVL